MQPRQVSRARSKLSHFSNNWPRINGLSSNHSKPLLIISHQFSNSSNLNYNNRFRCLLQCRASVLRRCLLMNSNFSNSNSSLSSNILTYSHNLSLQIYLLSHLFNRDSLLLKYSSIVSWLCRSTIIERVLKETFILHRVINYWWVEHHLHFILNRILKRLILNNMEQPFNNSNKQDYYSHHKDNLKALIKIIINGPIRHLNKHVILWLI